MKKASFFPKATLPKVILCLIFVAFVFFPFAQMVAKITSEDITSVFASPAFLPALFTSLKAAAATTLISVTLGFLLAFSLNRTNIPLKGVFTVLLVLPMLIPSISHSTGLIVLFGTNGILSQLLGMNGTIYGLSGIIVGSVIYSYPVAFLMFSDALKYEDGSPYEAAQVLGIPAGRRFFAITLPYLKKPLISATFSVFTLVITDYGIPLKIGGKVNTLATLMYQEVIGQFHFGQGSVIGLILLTPALVAFVINLVMKRQSKMGFVTRAVGIKKNLGRDAVSLTFCFAVLACILTLIGAFALVAFTVKYPNDMTPTLKNVTRMLNTGGRKALTNSVIISVIVAAIGSIVAFITAYFTSRMHSAVSSVLHLFSITSLAIPGIVLGLSYSMTFSGSFIYGTLAILILANLMHFFASPYQMMYNSLSGMNQNLENVGETLGISRFRIVRDVILPQSSATLIEMFSYFFVNSMMTISAVSFLANAKTKPVSLIIEQFNAQGNYEIAAVIAIIILVVNITMKTIVHFTTGAIRNRAKKASVAR